MSITLSQEVADEMAAAIESLLDQWAPCRDSSDYKCAWCGKRAENNGLMVKHEPDCKGEKFANILRPSSNGEEDVG